MGRVRIGDEVYVRRKTEKDATYWRQPTDEAEHEWTYEFTYDVNEHQTIDTQ